MGCRALDRRGPRLAGILEFTQQCADYRREVCMSEGAASRDSVAKKYRPIVYTRKSLGKSVRASEKRCLGRRCRFEAR
jgi:hypothetical protein